MTALPTGARDAPVAPYDDDRRSIDIDHIEEPAMTRRVRDAVFYACALAGPAVWFVLLCAAWAIAPTVHQTAGKAALLGMHALALACALAPGTAALREVRRVRRVGVECAAAARARVAGLAAAVLSAGAAALVIASALPLVLFTPF
jgi:hypothetical protein